VLLVGRRIGQVPCVLCCEDGMPPDISVTK
jgi:hypothetical protein